MFADQLRVFGDGFGEGEKDYALALEFRGNGREAVESVIGEGDLAGGGERGGDVLEDIGEAAGVFAGGLRSAGEGPAFVSGEAPAFVFFVHGDAGFGDGAVTVGAGPGVAAELLEPEGFAGGGEGGGEDGFAGRGGGRGGGGGKLGGDGRHLLMEN